MTISGTTDVAYQDASKDVTGLVTDIGRFVQNGNSTSVIRFSSVEDLGGGMSAQGYYEINPSLVAATSPTGATSGNATAIGNSQTFVGLSGGFGTIRMGKPNTGLLSTQGARTPYGTAIGSEYASMSLAVTRANGTFQYRSPAIQGFTVVVDYLPSSSLGAFSSSAPGKLAGLIDGTATTKNANIITVSGDVAGAKVAYSRSNNLFGDVKSQDDLSVQYGIDALTVYYGYSKANGAKATQNIAGKYTMGAIDLTANYTTNSTIGKSTTVGAAYNLSKRTIAYAKYTSMNADKVATPLKLNVTTVGLQHNF